MRTPHTPLEKMFELFRRRRAELWRAHDPANSSLCRSALWSFAHMVQPGHHELREIAVKARRIDQRTFTQANQGR
jgi:hypothetical protein